METLAVLRKATIYNILTELCCRFDVWLKTHSHDVRDSIIT
jgi:trans-aconitate methyltransferase